MRKKLTSLTALAMTIAMAGTLLTGCGSEGDATSSAPAPAASSTASSAESSQEQTAPEEVNTKPYEGTKLTWWTTLNANVSANYANLGETPWAQYVQEQTGIEIEFIHPASGSEKEEFAILLADGDYPDIIEYMWTGYSGGPGAAIEEGVILNLNDVMANSPNMQAVLAENPEIDRMIKTSDGDYYCYPFLRGTESPNATQFSSGFMLRKDVLDELKLEMPETIEDWETVLRAFKDYGFETPFVTRNGWMKECWSGGFDNWGDFYVDNGVVKNGLVEDSRKELISTLHNWYEEGLISKDWLVADKASNQTDFTTEKAAAVYAPFGQGLGTYTKVMNETNPEITEEDIRATVPVTSTKGKNAKFSKMNNIFDKSGVSSAITTSCKNVEAAAWLLDWMYSEEGNLCCNYGIEGVTYEMVNGVPTYTDVIMNNPDGMDVSKALAAYTRASTSGTCIQQEGYIQQYYEQDNQKEALELSKKTDMGEHFFPPVSVASEDSEEFATIMNNVKTRAEEMEAQFISGAASMDNWDSYIEQLKQFGIEDAIAMMQKAYDAYMAN